VRIELLLDELPSLFFWFLSFCYLKNTVGIHAGLAPGSGVVGFYQDFVVWVETCNEQYQIERIVFIRRNHI